MRHAFNLIVTALPYTQQADDLACIKAAVTLYMIEHLLGSAPAMCRAGTVCDISGGFALLLYWLH